MKTRLLLGLTRVGRFAIVVGPSVARIQCVGIVKKGECGKGHTHTYVVRELDDSRVI